MITGERIQGACDVTIWGPGDYKWITNPEHYVRARSIRRAWNNPPKIFCYGHRLRDFRNILPYLQHPFTLFSHNSDENITDQYADIANHRLLKHWYAQNLLFEHPKVTLMPIGIANSVWPHGDLAAFSRIVPVAKHRDFYFYFSIHTNVRDRIMCYITLIQKGIPFGSAAPNFGAYLQNLSSHKYAICPPGNGIDSHRIWEALYLGVIPVVLRSVFTEKIAKHVPCVLLNTWEEFDAAGLLASYSPPSMDTYRAYIFRQEVVPV